MGTFTGTAEASPRLMGFRRLGRALRQLFHEMTGAVFGILALGWLNSAIRAWTRDTAAWLIALAIGIAGLFAFFSVTQFIRSRKV